MKIKIITDLHVYGPHELDNARELIKQSFDFALGDIFDIKNCPKKLYGEAFIAEKKFYGKNFSNCVEGNHDKYYCRPYLTMREYPIMLTHGHLFLYDEARLKEITEEKYKYNGIGVLRYNAVKLFHKLYSYGNLSNADMKKAAAFARAKNCTTIIFGHVHPEKVIDKIVDGVRIICLPRGYSEVEI
jgi:predicted phosphodiesterase